MKLKTLTTAAILVLALQLSAHASGMLIPKDKSIPPLAIKYQRVDINIKDGVANARIEQVFKNSVNRDLEAVFVFPLPENASIADFAMYINGKRMSGELVEKDKARKIYEDIVRRMKDPGLLEHLGGNLFKISVFPVPRNGEQKIELEYSQTLAYDNGLYQFVYPLRTGEKASQTLEDFTVSARISSSVPIKNVYSPSHKVGISRKNENEAIIGFEEERAVLDEDFVIYYGVSEKDFGLNMLTHAVKGEDGFFMMMLAPRMVPKNGAVINKDVTFVMDTSGSMAGKKMVKTREALSYCINKLNKGDRFNIVRFSTDVELYSEKLVSATAKAKQDALAFVADMEARGGTAIDGALEAALAMDYNKNRPAIIAFLTDGKPTIGEADPVAIVKSVNKGNEADARIFVFGVGNEVNTHLLDNISGEHGGMSQYAKPDEDIEVKMSSFSDKMSQPVLSKVAVKVDKMKIKQLHPKEMPDLFAGEQLTIMGRYSGSGHVAIRLTGEVNGKKREFVYEGSFPKKSAENSFVPRLWATRRVGYLLDEIRLHGEKRELKNEVLKLSKEYGIMTPYTSYLVLENEKAYANHGIERPRPVSRPKAPAPTTVGRGSETASREVHSRWRQGGSDDADDGFAYEVAGNDSGPGDLNGNVVPMFEPEPAPRVSKSGVYGGRRLERSTTESVADELEEESGSDAVEVSQRIQRYKKADRASDRDDRKLNYSVVDGKTFYQLDGKWVDSAFSENMKQKKVKFASKEYFKLLKDKPELKKYLSLGEKVIVVLEDNTALVIE